MARAIAPVLFLMLAACESGIDAEQAAPPEPVGLTARSPRHCAHCGWIESKREILPGAAAPQAARSYEYTVRMTDGSSSVFQQALPATWRLGERLTVIGGAAPPH